MRGLHGTGIHRGPRSSCCRRSPIRPRSRSRMPGSTPRPRAIGTERDAPRRGPGGERNAGRDRDDAARRQEAARALARTMAGAFLAPPTTTPFARWPGYHVPKHLLSDFMTFSIPLKGMPSWKKPGRNSGPLRRATSRPIDESTGIPQAVPIGRISSAPWSSRGSPSPGSSSVVRDEHRFTAPSFASWRASAARRESRWRTPVSSRS